MSTESHSPSPSIRARWLLVALCLALLPLQCIARSIPYPIVFIHGLGTKTHQWDALRPQLDRQGLEFGGVVPAAGAPAAGYQPHADYFLADLGDANAGIAVQGAAVKAVLERLARDSQAPGFVLVGFSMGGLAARDYLVANLQEHRVRKLVTVGTPHQGSDWAYLYDVFQPVKQSCRSDDLAERLTALPLCLMLDTLEARLGVALDADALRDLMPPQWDADGRPLNPLAELADAPHPTDVMYVSVVGEVEPPADLRSIQEILEGVGSEVEEGDLGLTRNKARLLALVKNILGVLLDYPDWQGGGDGAVSADSQDMSHLPWFTRRISGVTETAWKGGTTLRYTLDGLDHPLRVELIDAHHLEEAARYAVLRRAIAEPPRLSLDDASGPVGEGQARLSGTVDDLLLQAGRLYVARLNGGQAERLDLTARIDADRRHFVFEHVPLQDGNNAFVVGYDADQVFGPAPEVRINIAGAEVRDLRYIHAAWAGVLGGIALAGLALWIAARRRRSRKGTNT